MLNRAKTIGAWLGKWDATPVNFLDIQWTTAVDNYLGVGLNHRASPADRWKRRVAALGHKLLPWRQRHIALTTRSHICNAVSYPAVLYPAQTMPIPPATANKVHRAWATFIWRSTYEPMRRTNLYWGLDRGGLGLVNVTIKLTVQRFLLFRDSRDPLIRAAFHHLGGNLLARWQVTTAEPILAERPLSFYKEIAAAIDTLQSLFSWEYLLAVKRRTLYWTVIEALLPPPLYRDPGLSDGKSDVLRRVRRSSVPTATKDLFFRYHTGILPTKVRQAERGFFVAWSTNCHLCGKPETRDHPFTECTAAIFFWAELQDFFGVIIDVTPEALRFLRCTTETSEEDLVHTVVLLGLHALWRTRVDVAECVTHPRPAWRHFVNKCEWTVSVLRGGEGDADLGETLSRGCEAARRFHRRSSVKHQPGRQR